MERFRLSLCGETHLLFGILSPHDHYPCLICCWCRGIHPIMEWNSPLPLHLHLLLIYLHHFIPLLQLHPLLLSQLPLSLFPRFISTTHHLHLIPYFISLRNSIHHTNLFSLLLFQFFLPFSLPLPIPFPPILHLLSTRPLSLVLLQQSLSLHCRPIQLISSLFPTSVCLLI